MLNVPEMWAMSYGHCVSVCLLSAAQISAALIKREDNSASSQGHTHPSVTVFLLLYRFLRLPLLLLFHLTSQPRFAPICHLLIPPLCIHCLSLFSLNLPSGFPMLLAHSLPFFYFIFLFLLFYSLIVFIRDPWFQLKGELVTLKKK